MRNRDLKPVWVGLDAGGVAGRSVAQSFSSGRADCERRRGHSLDATRVAILRVSFVHELDDEAIDATGVAQAVHAVASLWDGGAATDVALRYRDEMSVPQFRCYAGHVLWPHSGAGRARAAADRFAPQFGENSKGDKIYPKWLRI